MTKIVAVNLCDLSDLDRASAINPVSILLHGFCDEASPTVQTDKKLIDTYAVILDGPAAQDEERLDALVDVLQTIIGPRKLGRRVRCYQQGPRGGWSEIRP